MKPAVAILLYMAKDLIIINMFQSSMSFMLKFTR